MVFLAHLFLGTLVRKDVRGCSFIGTPPRFESLARRAKLPSRARKTPEDRALADASRSCVSRLDLLFLEAARLLGCAERPAAQTGRPAKSATISSRPVCVQERGFLMMESLDHVHAATDICRLHSLLRQASLYKAGSRSEWILFFLCFGPMSLNGSLYRLPRTASPDSPDGSLISFDSSSSGTSSNAWSGTFPSNINLNIAAFPGVLEQDFASNRAPSSSSYNAYSFGVLSGTGDDAAASLGGSSASGMDYFASPQSAWDAFFGGQTSAAISLPQTLPNVFNGSGFGAGYELGVGNSRGSEWPEAFPAANRKTGSKKSENGKKQVMACLFCRERKIGCIRPQEDEPDQTCNWSTRKDVCDLLTIHPLPTSLVANKAELAATHRDFLKDVVATAVAQKHFLKVTQFVQTDAITDWTSAMGLPAPRAVILSHIVVEKAENMQEVMRDPHIKSLIASAKLTIPNYGQHTSCATYDSLIRSVPMPASVSIADSEAKLRAFVDEALATVSDYTVKYTIWLPNIDVASEVAHHLAMPAPENVAIIRHEFLGDVHKMVSSPGTAEAVEKHAVHRAWLDWGLFFR
ncbi:Zn(2)-C6 fungal-type domain-containing protein [Mycena chlorophos]|uniref:Zn(2)-C6 fungal-type domain-containing protein n=1 Tax=Mycena chlorophos TaxID=658473 RepID=A0A8H6TP23_MYCCL|nr:Zn(2)-C6 fungal-type domain-containing protein [Mycena chlorophos]